MASFLLSFTLSLSLSPSHTHTHTHMHMCMPHMPKHTHTLLWHTFSYSSLSLSLSLSPSYLSPSPISLPLPLSILLSLPLPTSPPICPSLPFPYLSYLLSVSRLHTHFYFILTLRTISCCLSVLLQALPHLTDREKVVQIMDPALEGQYSMKEVIQVAAIAAMCVQPETKEKSLLDEGF